MTSDPKAEIWVIEWRHMRLHPGDWYQITDAHFRSQAQADAYINEQVIEAIYFPPREWKPVRYIRAEDPK